MIAFAHKSPVLSARRQNFFNESVQERFVSEYRTELLRPWSLAAYGKRQGLKKTDTLHKHVSDGMNKVAETTGALIFDPLRMDVGINDACRCFRFADSFLRSQIPSEALPEFADWSELETQLQAEFDCIQAKMWRGDFSTKTLTDAHERLTRMRSAIDKALAWIEKKLYSGKQS